jgi:hypothetical protein
MSKDTLDITPTPQALLGLAAEIIRANVQEDKGRDFLLEMNSFSQRLAEDSVELPGMTDQDAADTVLDLLRQYLDLDALIRLLQTRLDHASQRDIQSALDTARELARDHALASDQRLTWTHMAVLLRQQLARSVSHVSPPELGASD